MPSAPYRLSRRAAEDVADIADYTISTFGLSQARRYRNGLEQSFQYLAEYPHQGQSAGELAPGLRRHRYQSHMIFYRKADTGILVIRVLHARMDFANQL